MLSNFIIKRQYDETDYLPSESHVKNINILFFGRNQAAKSSILKTICSSTNTNLNSAESTATAKFLLGTDHLGLDLKCHELFFDDTRPLRNSTYLLNIIDAVEFFNTENLNADTLTRMKTVFTSCSSFINHLNGIVYVSVADETSSHDVKSFFEIKNILGMKYYDISMLLLTYYDRNEDKTSQKFMTMSKDARKLVKKFGKYCNLGTEYCKVISNKNTVNFNEETHKMLHLSRERLLELFVDSAAKQYPIPLLITNKSSSSLSEGHDEAINISIQLTDDDNSSHEDDSASDCHLEKVGLIERSETSNSNATETATNSNYLDKDKLFKTMNSESNVITHKSEEYSNTENMNNRLTPENAYHSNSEDNDVIRDVFYVSSANNIHVGLHENASSANNKRVLENSNDSRCCDECCNDCDLFDTICNFNFFNCCWNCTFGFCCCCTDDDCDCNFDFGDCDCDCD